jgi:hypothetical protein
LEAIVTNPFTPTFGVTPPVIAGRIAEIEAVRRALRNGVGDPARAVLFTGARGMGKTVLLNAVEQVAREQGWAVISETARPGLMDLMTHTTLPMLLARYSETGRARRIASGSVSVLGVGGSVTTELVEQPQIKPAFRYELARLARVMGKTGQGVLISLDEVQRGPLDELRELFQAIQHAFREGLEVAFVAAGLPSAVDAILNDEVLTFLRRSTLFRLGPLPAFAAAAAVREPIAAAGRIIEDAAVDAAVAAAEGYPFMLQLVGFEAWDATPGSVIGLSRIERAAARARASAVPALIEPALQDSSPGDLRFLRALAAEPDADVAATSLATALGVSRGTITGYRRRLIAAGVIEPAGRGRLRFALPGLRDHLRPESP